MPLGKTPAERYALRLRSACEKLDKSEPSLDFVGKVERVTGHGGKLGPGYEFSIYAASSSERGIRNADGGIAFVHVSDDGFVTIDLDEPEGQRFPEPLLECVVRRAEILR